MDKIRLGIIGVGNMGSGHLRNVAEGKYMAHMWRLEDNSRVGPHYWSC